MNKKFVLSLIAIIVICGLAAGTVVYLFSPAQAPLTPTGELDFTVSGSSDCLRFLNASVPTVYVPVTVAANQNWQLTINATKMPGGANGWTDVYIYEGFWGGGANHTCKAEDLYPIITQIESAGSQIRANEPFSRTFSSSTQQSYTVFFVMPPGGPATFHVTFEQV